jgi:hypothetical protein
MLEIVQRRKKIIPLGWTGRFNKHCATRIRTKQKGNIYFELPLKQFSVSLYSLQRFLCPQIWPVVMTANLNLRDFPFTMYELSRYNILVSPVTPLTSLSVCRLIARHFIALNPPTVCPSCSVAWQQRRSSLNQHSSPNTKPSLSIYINPSSSEFAGATISISLGIHPETCYVIFKHVYTIAISVIHCIALFLLQSQKHMWPPYWSTETCCNSFALLLPLHLAQKETHVLVFW